MRHLINLQDIKNKHASFLSRSIVILMYVSLSKLSPNAKCSRRLAVPTLLLKNFFAISALLKMIIHANIKLRHSGASK